MLMNAFGTYNLSRSIKSMRLIYELMRLSY